MFKSLQMGIFIFLLASILTMGGVGYYYWQWSQNRIETITANNTKLEQAIELSQQTVKQQQRNLEIQANRLKELNTNLNTIRKEADHMRKLLSNHDLSNLIDKKPSLMEKKQNDANRRFNEELERLTDPESYHE